MIELSKDKIAIIIHSSDEQYLEECLNYVEMLEIPELYTVDVFVGDEASEKAVFYNEAMEVSDAKYKLYLSENTFIVQKDCLLQCIKLFEENEKLGMLGILGSKGEAKLGKAIVSDSQSTGLHDFQKGKDGYYIAEKLDEAFLFTQYDIAWENASEHAADFVENGYLAAVPYQDIAWCQVDINLPVGKVSEEQQIYNYIKFLLRRIQYQLPEEKSQAFYEDYEEGFIGKTIVDAILGREILYPRRVRHMMAIHNKEFRYSEADGEMGERMNVITSLNRKYVPQVCVMLESLYANNQEVPIRVFLLHSELIEEDEKLITEHANKWGASASFLKVEKKYFEKMPATELWTVESFFRLAMIDMLPADVDRLLYLDVDLAILKPVYDLYFADFEGTDLIACKDMGSNIPFGDVRDEVFRELVGKETFVYCCAGVMLWNIEKLRNNVTLETYLQAAEALNYRILAPDQDLINLIHGEQIKIVDEFQYDCFVKGYNWSSDEVKRYVSILHYAGATKPWSGKYPKIDVYKVWWEYAKNTPLYLQMLETCFEESYETDRTLYNSIKHLTEKKS